MTQRNVERFMGWSIGSCGAHSASGKRPAPGSVRANRQKSLRTSRDPEDLVRLQTTATAAPQTKKQASVTSLTIIRDRSNISELCTGFVLRIFAVKVCLFLIVFQEEI